MVLLYNITMNERIYLCKTEYLDVSVEKKDIMDKLPDYRKKKLEKIKNETAWLESLTAGLLLVKGLAGYMKISESEALECLNSKEHDIEKRNIIIYTKAERTKQIFYSISHSGGYVAAAFASEAVGLDIETKDDRNFSVTRRMFSEEDKIYIGDSQERFRNIWTVKESFLKCTGEGIVVPLKSFISVKDSEAADDDTRWRIVSKGYDLKGKTYFVMTNVLDENCSISICSENPNIGLDIEWVKVLI